ncbi:hypothetical protein FQN54_004296 [Arachnomyces sp. PD_36]|nr:hypothetical protein FQN54_004296 [Arachnomyces sp. PD_36]
MGPHRRNNIVARRRRLEDEGEEEDGSIGGDLEDDSLSEGSVLTAPEDDADGEGSDVSEGEGEAAVSTKRDKPGEQVNGDSKHHLQADSTRDPAFGAKMADTQAMMNGMELSEPVEGSEEINFEDMGPEPEATEKAATEVEQPSKRETFAERKRREHEEYIKERNENPAFVPTRGGFFLHDKRSESGSNGYRQFNNNKKSRPHGLIVDSNTGRRAQPKSEPSSGQWTHDLHETVARDDRPPQKPASYQNNGPFNGSKPVPTAPRSSPPNRSFSSTVVIGNVPVIVHLPGMVDAIPYSAVPKKQHTRLPQHRPPLRRDKPVRISLPGQAPRYIFPAVERSFIFIPRALRPNQQGFHRGRGRGGFYVSRRTSAYGGSTYSPSVAMSRRSSFGRATSREGVHSPAGSVLSRQMTGPEGGKPVVRLPPPVRPPAVAGPAPFPPPNASPNTMFVPYNPQQPPYPPPQDPAYRENRPAPIPMHQPRPQKTVSVADIESPAGLSFNPPQQQQEQPFHQQVPPPATGPGYAQGGPTYPHARHPSHPSQASGTPLSQIPERAIYAQPFQPYPFQQPAGFYPPNQPPGAVYYPEYPGYNAPGPVPPGPGYAPAGPQQAPYGMAAPGPAPTAEPSGTVAHESNGMVYYYDSSQLYGGNPAMPRHSMPPAPPPAGGVVGMGGMMTPPSGYYYPQPQGMYYPPQ